jgi:hypothetical protein
MSIGTRANKQPRGHGDLDAQLARQLKFLARSSEAFDAGEEDEAIRLATILRVLLHDTTAQGRDSHSLLMQLGHQQTLSFVDTGLYRQKLDQALDAHLAATNPGMVVAAIQPGEAGLVVSGQALNGRPAWVAPLGSPRFHPQDPRSAAMVTPHAFSTWWSTPLVEASSGKQFSRKDLVLIMANQDGGAHVDPQIDADYADLVVDFLGVEILVGEECDGVDVYGTGPLPGGQMQGNVAAASVRQIAYELFETLERAGIQCPPYAKVQTRRQSFGFGPMLVATSSNP